jgi:hypothetical protein
VAFVGVQIDSSAYGGLVVEGQNSLPPTIYEIRIKGHLNHIWDEWFYDLGVTHEEDGTTTLYGPLPDQTVLHSVLDRIRDMNLRLISVTEVKATPSDR